MQWFNIILQTSSLIGAIIVIYKASKWLNVMIVNKIQKMVRFQEVQEKQNIIEGKLDKILHELTFNGGGSTKDFIKHVQEAIIRVESRQQALLDMPNMQDGLFECDKDGSVIWTNKVLSIMLGKTPDDLVGSGWYNSIDRTEKYDVIEEWEKCMCQKRDFIMDINMEVANCQYKKIGRAHV